MRRYAVVGGGFGLYGYCQCILDHDLGDLFLWDGYRARFMARPELAGRASRVVWRPDLDATLAAASHVIIAVPPAEQAAVLDRSLSRPGLSAVGLEKPLAADPAAAIRILERLRDWGGRWRVDYSFLHACWFPRLRERVIGATDDVVLRWTFLAHHHRHRLPSWKREVALGGGALRFYGVHVIALARALGYANARSSETCAEMVGEADVWQAVLAGPGLPDLRIMVHTREANPLFHMADRRGDLLALTDPFDAEDPVVHGDRRCPILLRFLEALEGGPVGAGADPELAVLRLWDAIESINRHRTVSAD